MAKWQITDTDLINTNIANWVEIFWVTWNYSNSILDTNTYFLGWPAIAWDLWSSWNYYSRWFTRFYDDWTKIIIMWCSLLEANWAWASQHWWAYYYAEILKSTWVLTVYPYLPMSLWTSVPYWNSKIVFINIGWTNRYAFTAAPNDSSPWFVFFNWTEVVDWYSSSAAILLASNIWSTSISFRWKTLWNWTLFQMWDTIYYWAWWACMQTLYYG